MSGAICIIAERNETASVLSADDMLGKRDTGLDSLLDLDGCIFEQENGFWVKIEARLIAVSVRAPHGIAYSLTLHNVFGNRVLGYDNAHAVKWPRKFKYAGRRQLHDHRHRSSADPVIKESSR
jgi:hypothetical protein